MTLKWKFIIGIMSLCLAIGARQTDNRMNRMQSRITELQHACVPLDTGGGVSQCANPNVYDLAYRACLKNDAYFGGTAEDNRQLFSQCISDWLDMKGY